MCRVYLACYVSCTLSLLCIVCIKLDLCCMCLSSASTLICVGRILSRHATQKLWQINEQVYTDKTLLERSLCNNRGERTSTLTSCTHCSLSATRVEFPSCCSFKFQIPSINKMKIFLNFKVVIFVCLSPRNCCNSSLHFFPRLVPTFHERSIPCHTEARSNL